MKIAIAQLNYTIGDIESNKMKIIDAVNKAKAAKADLVVFSEFAISGAPAYHLLNRVNFLSSCEDALVEITACCDNIAVLVGLPVQRECYTVSAAAYIRNCHLVRYITKKRVVLAEERGYVSSGDGCGYINLNSHRIAVMLGHDVYNYSEYVNCDLAVCMAADRFYTFRPAWRDDFTSKHSFMANAPIVFANQVGANTGTIYDGGSMVYDAMGQRVLALKHFEEDFGMVDIDQSNPVVPDQVAMTVKWVHDALCVGIRDYFAKNGWTDACLVVSGGIDSSVVAALAVEVLGKDHVHALRMPSRYSNDHSDNDAEKLCENLGVRCTLLPLTDVYANVSEQFGDVLGDRSHQVDENFMLRLRCCFLMAAYDKFGYIPLNTSNKTELAFGGATVYGDAAGALSVLGDLYKGMVFRLARYINRNGEIIPEPAFERSPTCELLSGEDELGENPTYEIVDSILYRLIEEGQSTEEIVNSAYDATTVDKVAQIFIRTTSKRFQFCPILRVTVHPFDKNQNIIPLTCKYGF